MRRTHEVPEVPHHPIPSTTVMTRTHSLACCGEDDAVNRVGGGGDGGLEGGDGVDHSLEQRDQRMVTGTVEHRQLVASLVLSVGVSEFSARAACATKLPLRSLAQKSPDHSCAGASCEPTDPLRRTLAVGLGSCQSGRVHPERGKTLPRQPLLSSLERSGTQRMVVKRRVVVVGTHGLVHEAVVVIGFGGQKRLEGAKMTAPKTQWWRVQPQPHGYPLQEGSLGPQKQMKSQPARFHPALLVQHVKERQGRWGLTSLGHSQDDNLASFARIFSRHERHSQRDRKTDGLGMPFDVPPCAQKN